MTAIGETLRRERLKRNLDLDAVSRELKISQRFLEAIEDERFDLLPRGVFAKSFVRQYARMLGLDEEELANEVQRAVDPSPAVPQFAEHAPVTPPAEIHVPRMESWQNISDTRFSRRSSSLPALAMLVVVMLLCSGVYALWQRTRHSAAPREDTPAQTAQTSSRLPHNIEPASPAAPPPAQAAQTQPPPANTADRPVVDTAASKAASAPPAVAPATGTPPEVGTRVQIPNANPHGPLQVAVTADELVWVMVKTDGKISFSGTMEAQQTHTFDATDNVTVRLGNAGGVSLKLNGQPIGSVGPRGQVRTVQFTSGGFQIVAPPKPVLPPEALL
ncbi:MAG TPA: RodZ domain-containing protein [Bryobacteraceae bacterium]|nr:RodZ domain-containing protein [Bryobacteraceae bacterium]